jgi:type VI secretion system protein ImpB
MPNLKTAQHWLDRNRRPRVQITYDVDDDGATVKTELPFIVGVLADFRGDSDPNGKQLRDRKFVRIDQDSFTDVLQKIGPSLTLDFSGEGEPNPELGKFTLKFNSMKDFEPFGVANQVPAIKKLFYERKQLVELLARLSLNPALSTQLGTQLSAQFNTQLNKFGWVLDVMPSQTDPSKIPPTGKSRIIVAPTSDNVYFRIFDDKGQKVVDTDGNKVKAQEGLTDAQKQQLGDQITAFKTYIAGLSAPLSDGDKRKVIAELSSIVGFELIPARKSLEVAATKAVNDALQELLITANATSIPPNGNSLVVVAPTKDKLYFRIFDDKGNMAVDTDDTALAGKTGLTDDQKTKLTGQITALKTLLASVSTQAPLSDGDKGKIITSVQSIVGYTS